MGQTILLILTTLSLKHVVHGYVGAECRRLAECGDTLQYCEQVSPSCGGLGMCQCIPGFKFDKSMGSCIRAPQLYAECFSPDSCVGNNVACDRISNVCYCRRGFYQFEHETYCIEDSRTQPHGQKCFDEIQCLPGMDCNSRNLCECLPGTKPCNITRCCDRRLGDFCESVSDCSRIPGSSCQNGRCQCLPGYTGYEYFSHTFQKKDACSQGTSVGGAISGPVLEGERCNDDIFPNSTFTFCKLPYVCTYCGPSQGRICALILPNYIQGATTSSISAMTLGFTALFLLFATYQ